MKKHNYLQGGFLVLISILIHSAVSAYGAEESITLTTYYPSPYGVYNEMRLYPKAPPAPGACSEGTMYYNNVDHQLYVCGGSGWQTLGGGYWAANSNDIYNKNLGNVGVGTMSPAEKLDVVGSVHFSDKVKAGNLSAANNILSVAGATETGGFAVGFANGSGVIIAKNASLSGPGVGILGPSGVPAIGMGGDTAGLGYLEAYLGRDLQLKTQTAQIYLKDSTGNVGIGTASPGAKLDVAGIAQMTGFRMPTGASNGYVLTSNAAGAGTWQLPSGGLWTASGTNIYNANSGNVGIGTASPSTKLHVAGGIRVTGLVSCNTIDTDASGNFICGTDETGGVGSSGITSINSQTGPAITLSAGSGIGISTTASNNIQISYTGGAAGGVTGSGLGNYIPKFTGSTTLGNSQIYDNGSYVGIGTTSPGSKLTVGAPGNLEIQNGVIYVKTSYSGSTLQLYARDVRTSNNEDLYLNWDDASGNVVIGGQGEKKSLYFAGANGATGSGSYIDAPDYYIRSTGKWASQLGGGGAPWFSPYYERAYNVPDLPDPDQIVNLGSPGQFSFCSLARVQHDGVNGGSCQVVLSGTQWQLYITKWMQGGIGCQAVCH